MSGTDSEEITGLIRDLQSNVSTKMVDMIITNKRILLIRTKSQLIEPMKGRGVVGAAMAHYSEKKERNTPQKTLEEALAEDPKNQSIPYTQIDHVKLKKGWFSTDIWIFLNSGKKLHLGINSKIYYDEWKPILKSTMPHKFIP